MTWNAANPRGMGVTCTPMIVRRARPTRGHGEHGDLATKDTKTQRAALTSGLCFVARVQNVVVSPTRTARGNPGEMFVLLSALMKYFLSKRFSTLTWKRNWRVTVKNAAASARV